MMFPEVALSRSLPVLISVSLEAKAKTSPLTRRIAEEAVTNAVKHAGAKSTTIGLAIRAGRPVLENDGKGIGPKLKTEVVGLRNMEYRASVTGRDLTIEALRREAPRL